MVEFALILPVFMMLMVGTVSAATDYNLSNELTHATREAARYGATYPTGSVSGANLNSWLDSVYTAAVQTGDHSLDASTGAYVCVAYVGRGSGSYTGTDVTRKREQTGTGSPVYTDASSCYTDTAPMPSRVQVLVTRSARLEAVLWSQSLTLHGQGLARFEALQ